ncbi:MAG: bile acid:sodium symporter [Chitinophagaceae bacterium]|nr:bile acid:sodium symporter [Chitinophagaceae bacterium]MCW5926070.1 bile acid:sodium symporter [Chitinophagaceae bacterium]
MTRTLKRIGIDGFLVAIIVVIFVAYVFPEAGIQAKPVSLDQVGAIGLSLIFFFYGLKLNPSRLKSQLSNWRMHLVIQFSTFILFPVIGLAVKPLFGSSFYSWLGVFYLCALPSTVSSSVVMVSIAGGNMPAAIFNASISTLLGVFITPLWILPLLEHQAGSIDTTGIILKLIVQVLVPVMAGLLFNSRWGALAEKYKKPLRYFDQSIILLIIYTAFCHSFYEKAFDGYTGSNLLRLGAGMSILFYSVYYIIKWICKKLRFTQEDSTTVLFCGSKKSLVHASVMSKVLFPASSMVSIILLPIMVYHALQLIFVSILAQKLSRTQKN